MAKDLAAYATKDIPDSMKDHFAWIKKTTGIEVDERSAYLGYTLRSDYQAANRAKASGTAPAAKTPPAATPKAPARKSAAGVRPGRVIVELTPGLAILLTDY